MKVRTLGLALLLVVASGCFKATPLPYRKGDAWENPVTGATEPFPDATEAAKAYCKRVSATADTRSQGKLVGGVLLTILASSLFIVGNAMGPGSYIAPGNTEPHWAERNRNSLFISGAGVLAIPSTLLLTSSADSSRASAAAGLGMSLDEDAALKRCLEARAELVNARAALATSVGDESRIKDATQLVRDSALKSALQKRKEAELAPTAAAKAPLIKQAEEEEAKAEAADSVLRELLK